MSEATKNSNIMDLDYAVTYRLYAFKSLALILGETGNHDFSEILFHLYYLAEREITDILDCVSR